MVSADGAVVDDDVPGPEGDGVPLSRQSDIITVPLVQEQARDTAYLFHFESLLAITSFSSAFGRLGLCGGRARVFHLYVRHWFDLDVRCSEGAEKLKTSQFQPRETREESLAWWAERLLGGDLY